jgi:hypothetical protein
LQPNGSGENDECISEMKKIIAVVQEGIEMV